MQTTMKAAVLHQPMDISIQDVPVPQPRSDEALVRVHCIGICGSDIHYYEHGRIGRYVVEKPIILGHELAGEVVAIGSEVQNLAVGDRVAIEPGVPCGRCDYCKRGRYNLCPRVVFMATPPVDGAWAEYVSLRSDFLHKIPDHMSFEEGALIEPLSVGFHAMRRGRVGPGDKVLVSGLGPIGMLAASAAKMFGAGIVIGTDVIPFRRELALSIGADKTLDASAGDLEQQLLDATDGAGVDVVVETSGHPVGMANSVRLVNFGGRLVFVGLPPNPEVPLDVTMIADKELDIFGVFRYVNTYPDAIAALATKKYPVERAITHKYALRDIREACEVARLQKDAAVKVMIYPHL